MPIFVGIGDAIHDTSIAALIDGEFKYRKSERHLGVKHHEASDNWYKQTLKDWGIDKPDRLCYTDKGRIRFGKHVRKPYNGEDIIIEDDVVCIDHHTAHLHSTLSNAEQHAVFDGRGSGGNGGRYTGLIVTPDEKIRYKQLGIGKMLTYVGHCLNFKGLEVDFPGKIMGLQAYGTPDLELASQINQDNILDLCEPWIKKGVTSKDKDFQNFVATVHKACELIQLDYFSKFDPDRLIACSGGVMLNTVINTELRKKYKLYIPPHVYDGGLSIGALRYAVGKNFEITKFPYVQDDWAPEEPSDQTIDEAAELLAQGHIVGWYQGHGELGPRALGNRSILMNPTMPNGKDILNERVKKREWWRPFGASVIHEAASKYFDIDDSPYMLYNSNVLVDGLDPITHVDGTCRHQTVSEASNSSFYRLLSKFEEKTGLPILLNTSLNVGGKPIASDKNSAMVEGLDCVFFGNEKCTSVS